MDKVLKLICPVCHEERNIPYSSFKYKCKDELNFTCVKECTSWNFDIKTCFKELKITTDISSVFYDL